MSKALVNRSLTTVRTELEFLLDSGIISQAFYDTINKSLPERYSEGATPAEIQTGSSVPPAAAPAPVSSPSNEKAAAAAATSAPPSYQSSTTTLASSSTPEEWVEAIYDYAAQQPEDLPLRVGDKIKVLDKPNPNWSKGSCNGRTGMFPTNYTKPVFGSNVPNYDEKSKSTVPFQAPPPSQYFQPQYQQPQPQYNQYQPPQQLSTPPPFPPASTGYYQQPQQFQQAATNQQPQGEGHLKKFGKKFGDAAIFGAGATMGSDIINHIF